MPSRPPRPCNFYGCPNLTHDRFCQQHAPQARQAAQEALQDRRGKTAERGYGSDWRAVRAAYLRTHPLCERCEAAPSMMVHHVRPLRRGGERLDWANLAALCGEPCHALCHAGIDRIDIDGMSRDEIERRQGVRMSHGQNLDIEKCGDG